MRNTLILVVSHRGISPETRACLDALECPSRIVLDGNANICKARSIAFDQALAATEGTPIDTVLCVDDDMVFPPAAAQRLVDLSRAAAWPVSAIAVKQDGGLAAWPAAAQDLKEPQRKLWFTGLAFMAVPRRALVEVAEELDQDAEKLEGIRQWCLTGEHPFFPGRWTGEDAWFCSHFGGVELAPIAVGHLKWIALWPEDATVAAVTGTGQN